MEFQKSLIKEIYYTEKVDLPNQAIPQETKVVVCENLKATIERIPNNKFFAVTGIQLNNKATYVMYFGIDLMHLKIPQEATIIYTLVGDSEEYSGKIKFWQTFSDPDIGYTREYYIQSDNL